MKCSLMKATGMSSVPSVWIGGRYIGGCNDGRESWMGTLPNLQNGNINKWLAEFEANGTVATSAAGTANSAAAADKPEFASDLVTYDCHVSVGG